MTASSGMSILPEIIVGELLGAHKLTLAIAESCTGGLVTSRLTDVPGSSAYVMGGLVAYANDIKMHFLGVQEASLIAYGSVSEKVAAEMATGVRIMFNTDFGISLTGIAGPGGGTPQKPVGLTYIGLSFAPTLYEKVARYIWNGDRLANKQASADAAFQLLIDYLSALD